MNIAVSRISAFLAILALTLIPAAAQPPRDPGLQQVEIKSQAIEAFDPRNVSRKRFGALEFRGGLVLDVAHEGIRRHLVAARGAPTAALSSP